MRIHKDFIGGNIKVERINNDTVYLKNELRDTEGDWFYWAFCVEGAASKTVTFKLEANRLGYFSPALSNDLINWHWLGEADGDSFTYTFAEKEDKVYFAHSMLYHPVRFVKLAKNKGLNIQTLCKSKLGRDVPYVTLGEGSKTVILTARHHACESTGSYVLEGVLCELVDNPIEKTKIICVPFVDYDGVLNGDQGKSRRPHDHNRDYPRDGESIYSSTAAIRDIAERNSVYMAFDFHSPWHKGDINDRVFIVQPNPDKIYECKRFGDFLEECITAESLKYETKNDYPPDFGWNRSDSPTCSRYMLEKGAELAFSLETAYFGDADNVFSAERAIELGRCVAKAIRKYIII